MCSVAHGEQAGSLCLLHGINPAGQGVVGSWGSVRGAGNHMRLSVFIRAGPNGTSCSQGNSTTSLILFMVFN